MIEPISIDFASLNMGSLAPMLVAIVGALTILCIDLFSKKLDKSLYVILTILFLMIYENIQNGTSLKHIKDVGR